MFSLLKLQQGSFGKNFAGVPR